MNLRLAGLMSCALIVSTLVATLFFNSYEVHTGNEAQIRSRWLSAVLFILAFISSFLLYVLIGRYTQKTRRNAHVDASGVAQEGDQRKENAQTNTASALSERMLSVLPLGVITYQESGQCVYANEAAAKAIDGSQEKLLAQNFKTDAFWYDAALVSLARTVLATGTPDKQEIRLTTEANRDVWLECYFTRFARSGNLYLLLVIKDIMARKFAERALIHAKENAENANNEKTRFIERMSRGMRTPLNAMLGFTQILNTEPLTREQREFVNEIDRSGDYLLDLINELLDLSRIESGKLIVVVQPTELASVVRQAIQLVHSDAVRYKVTIVENYEPSLVVLADSTRLRQILVNLLSNAVKYNRVGGKVVVDSVLLNSKRVRIRVSDSGPGIPQDKMNKLFKTFERLGAESTGVRGTGVGLAYSNQLAELMGAILGVESTLGQGSTFWLDLPLPEINEVKAMHEQQASMQADLRPSVLYIEDNATNMRLIETVFRYRPDLRFIPATNGEHGLELASRYLPAVILLDIHLPGLDGYAVLAALKNNPSTASIPVIAVSADAMPVDVERGIKAGFNYYVTKPVKIDELMAALDRLLPKR